MLPSLTGIPGITKRKGKRDLPTFVCPTGQQRIKGEQEKQSNSCQHHIKLGREITDGNSFEARNPSATASSRSSWRYYVEKLQRQPVNGKCECGLYRRRWKRE